jgi:nuclear GTP-binding protein
MQQARAHLLDVEPFEHAFGPKGKRKRPKLTALDYESLLKRADDSHGESWTLIIITL